jgi:hypothetical protein
MFKFGKKKEVKAKEVKTGLKEMQMGSLQSELDNLVDDYLKNASKHLYQRKDCNIEKYGELYYKVMPITINDVRYALTMEIGEGGCNVSIKAVGWIATKNNFGYFKDLIFPKYYKHRSVRQRSSEKMLELGWTFKMVDKFIKNNPDLGKEELEKEIKKMLN